MVKQMNGAKFHSRHLSWTEDNEPLSLVVIDLLHVNNYMQPWVGYITTWHPAEDILFLSSLNYYYCYIS